MPRRPREEEAGAIHHVFGRGNNSALIYRDDTDRWAHVRLLEVQLPHTGWCVLAWCQMGTHFHLVVKTPEPNLYWGMQRWLSPYATEFHRRHGTHGHVFERPFGSARIKDDRQLKTTIRYVVWNPVEAKMCRTPEEHVWGSHRHVLSGTRDPLVNAEELLGYFGANGGDPLATYADFTTVA